MTTSPLMVRRPGRALLRGIRGYALLAGLACVAVALSGCGTQPAGAIKTTGAARTGGSAPASGSPRQRAVADAAHIIASFPRPPGAARSGLIASLSTPGQYPLSPDLVTATEWWIAPGRPVAVLAWVRAHVRSGFSVSGSGSAGHGRSVVPGSVPPRSAGQHADLWFDQFSLPVVTNVLTERSLLVTVVADGSKHTALRVDAQVIWLPAKPAAERIPPAARVVTVTPEIDAPPDTPGAHLDHAFTVTGAAKVSRIAAAIDGRPVYPPGESMCGPDANVEIGLVFLTSPHSQVVAVVDTDGPCDSVSVTINGRRMPALSNFFNPLTPLVLSIAGVRWPYDPGAPG
jgi:hypothetical protein